MVRKDAVSETLLNLFVEMTAVDLGESPYLSTALRSCIQLRVESATIDDLKSPQIATPTIVRRTRCQVNQEPTDVKKLQRQRRNAETTQAHN